MNKEEHSVFINQEKINLTIKEFSLLEILLSTQRKVFTWEELLSKVWGMDFAGETRTVDVHIKTLRKKLNEYGAKIQVVKGRFTQTLDSPLFRFFKHCRTEIKTHVGLGYSYGE